MDNLPYRGSYRLKKFNYSNAGYYYITICVNRRLCYFGEVREGMMELSNPGIIAEKFWREIPEHYPDVDLDAFVIMPNHIHGIVVLRERPASGRPYTDTGLSKIIGSYKNIVCKTLRKFIGSGFEWQHSFYDHIIRNDADLNRIREYIVNNPKQWELDKENPEHS